MTGSASVAGPRLLAAAEPTLASFYHQPWWLVIIKVLFIFIFLVLVTLFMIWAERRVIGRMQQRPGPNRAGKFGLLQSLMDGIKLALKEDIVPRNVDMLLFWLARPSRRSRRSSASRSSRSVPRCPSSAYTPHSSWLTCRSPCCWCWP